MLPKRIVAKRKETLRHPRLPTRYWGPFRQEWYSLSSDPNAGGPETGFGMWISVYKQWIDHQFHDHIYPIWYWWHNRK